MSSPAPTPPDATAYALAPTRARATWDVALSIVFLVFGLVTTLIAVLAQGFIFVFTDYCPPATCHIDQGVTSVLVVWSVMAIILLVGIVLTIVFLVQRRRAWWIALIGLVAQIVCAVLAFALYVAAVG